MPASGVACSWPQWVWYPIKSGRIHAAGLSPGGVPAPGCSRLTWHLHSWVGAPVVWQLALALCDSCCMVRMIWGCEWGAGRGQQQVAFSWLQGNLVQLPVLGNKCDSIVLGSVGGAHTRAILWGLRVLAESFMASFQAAFPAFDSTGGCLCYS